MDANERLARIEERLSNAIRSLDNVVDDVEEFIEAADKRFATKDEIGPIRLLVFGVVGLILAAVVTAGVTLLLKAN